MSFKSTIFALIAVLCFVGLVSAMCNKMACPPVSRLNCWHNGGRFFRSDITSVEPKHCCDVCLYQGEIDSYCNSTVTLEWFDQNARGYLAGCLEDHAVCVMNQNKCFPYLN
ncbi:hypothetical protein SAMD00019534_045430 [Acytostelium subglobosum LB1]|uniref:hypothetical protein n=1 Tax=Acytostelium subglobosum LB1 TaxID=1410327 RepID=UPI000644D51C|nr:hypothetical protein SAMD00019534_045430 [Acytostelium subglobosum LB1]GAM21368.1 hypothetical protein SAMD00019534_045430 [Acytostelium subglobosum LB1]|eukprot:XP_012755487.1 hypothetical protein SAMD00019534_045430 [Acytostelium subglobosum LB1]